MIPKMRKSIQQCIDYNANQKKVIYNILNRISSDSSSFMPLLDSAEVYHAVTYYLKHYQELLDAQTKAEASGTPPNL